MNWNTLGVHFPLSAIQRMNWSKGTFDVDQLRQGEAALLQCKSRLICSIYGAFREPFVVVKTPAELKSRAFTRSWKLSLVLHFTEL